MPIEQQNFFGDNNEVGYDGQLAIDRTTG